MFKSGGAGSKVISRQVQKGSSTFGSETRVDLNFNTRLDQSNHSQGGVWFNLFNLNEMRGLALSCPIYDKQTEQHIIRYNLAQTIDIFAN